MQKYQNNVTTNRGVAVARTLVRVDNLDGTLATIYSDNGVTVTSNPMLTNENGYFEFYADTGRYNILISGGEAYTDFQIADVVEAVVEADADAAAAAASAAAAAATLAGAVKTVDLAASGGAGLVGDTGPVATPYLQTVSDINNGNPVSLFRFIDPTKISAIRGFSSAYDATPDIQDAFDSGAKRLIGEYGLFNLESSVVSAAPMILDGSGAGTIFNQVSITDKASFKLLSSADGVYIDGVVFRNFVLRCLTGTFAEQQHLIEANGVRDAIIEGVMFSGFRGDAIYLGAGAGANQRHNENVRITKCVFDGVNNENRNAISIVDCDGITIDHNKFIRCTKSTMPGPIDFEPNANAWHVVRNIHVLGNQFSANGGNVGEVAFAVPSAVTVAPSAIEVAGNFSSGYVGTGSFFSYNENRLPTSTSAETGMRISGNKASSGYRPYTLFNGKNITLSQNVWEDFAQAAIVGFTGGTSAVRDITLLRERYIRGGSTGGNGMSIYNVTEMDVRDTKFIDCGTGSAGSSNAIDFNTGTSSGVKFRNVEFSAPTSKTLVAIQKEAGHTLTPSTNSLIQSTWGTLSNFFLAEESDCILSDYPAATPVSVEGGTTVGTTITYAERYGKCRYVGKEAEIYFRLDITTHDGVGPIEVSLPFPAASVVGSSSLRIVGNAIITGLAANGSVIARMNVAASAGGIQGAIRFYSSTAAPGAVALINMPGAGVPFLIEGYARYERTV